MTFQNCKQWMSCCKANFWYGVLFNNVVVVFLMEKFPVVSRFVKMDQFAVIWMIRINRRLFYFLLIQSKNECSFYSARETNHFFMRNLRSNLKEVCVAINTLETLSKA